MLLSAPTPPPSTVPGCARATDPVLLRSRSRWRLCSACMLSSRGRSVSDEETSRGWTRPLESTHCLTRPTTQTTRTERVEMGSSIRSGLSWAVGLWSFYFRSTRDSYLIPPSSSLLQLKLTEHLNAVTQRSLAPNGGLKTSNTQNPNRKESWTTRM